MSSRTVRSLIVTGITALVVLPHGAPAQAAPAAQTAPAAPAAPAALSTPKLRHWEFRVASGALLPTGAQRQALNSGALTAAQISWTPRPSFALTGTFGWAKSRDLGAVNTPRIIAYASDLGVEFRSARWFAARKVTFDPFVGVGAGARSYDYRSIEADATHNLSGYGAVGGELGAGRVGLRLEARNHVSGSKPLVGGGASDARSDMIVMATVRFNRRRAAKN